MIKTLKTEYTGLVCKDCRYYGKGNCRINPPVAPLINAMVVGNDSVYNGNPHVRGGWPEVKEDDWCSQGVPE